MTDIKTKRTFLELFSTDTPLLKVKFNIHSDEEAIEVQVENKLEKSIDKKGFTDLLGICTNSSLNDSAPAGFSLNALINLIR